MREQVIRLIEQNKIIAIVRGANPEQAVNVAKALSEGGIKLVEVTFNRRNRMVRLSKLEQLFVDGVNELNKVQNFIIN